MATESEPLAQELAFFKANLPQWLKQYRGRVVVVKGSDLAGVYDNERDALAAAASAYGTGPYLIRRVTDAPPTCSNIAYELGLIGASPR